MNMFRRSVLASLVLVLAAPAALAQAYPAKPVRIVVPFAPGGGADVLARALAQKLAERWKQPVLVENKPGGSGVIAADAVLKSAADGHTIMLGSVGTHAINASLIPNLPYDPLRDFAPVALIAKAPNLLVVNSTVKASTLPELIALARANPKAVSYASSGNGSSQHLSAELFQSMAGVQMNHVPYKGAAQAVTDLVSGVVNVSFTGLTTVMPFVKTGQLRAIAVTTAGRSRALPNIPTVGEAGVAGYESLNWLALFMPAATPPAIVAKASADILEIINGDDATVRTLMDPDGYEFNRMPPAEVRAFVQSEIQKWRGVIGKANIRAE